MFRILLLLASWLSLVSSLATAAKNDTCAIIQKASRSIKVAYPNSWDYSDSQSEYWNKASRYMTPTCILYPKTAADVVQIVQVLGANDEKFAVKGGGHMPNVLFNDVNGGPVINLSKIKTLDYDPETQSAKIGPGNRWHDVAQGLEKFGRNVVGGRIGHVGVPGLLLGGGLSFLSTQYGWASTHVLEYEIVFANGTLATVTKESNPELHRVLQGGGNNFGIVTQFTLRTFPQGKVWGGTRMFSDVHTPTILAAIRDFTEHYPDPKAAIIATGESLLYGSLGLWTVFFFYDGPSPPAGVFDNFTRLASSADTTKTQSFTDLVYANNAFSLNGSFYTIATETMPLPSKENGVQVMQSVHDYWAKTSAPAVKNIFGTIASIAYQPLPRLISEATQRYGGNFMDLGNQSNRIVLEYDYSYINAFDSNAEFIDQTTQDLVKGTRNVILEHVREKKTLDDTYLPLFMNDAYYKQDYWARFQHRDLARKVKEDVDPGRFFGKRTQTFKL